MRKSLVILFICLIIISLPTPVHAASNNPVAWPGFTAPALRPEIARPPITQNILPQNEMSDFTSPFGVGILTLVENQRYEYVKGGEFFGDFFGLPDFRHYAWLSPLFVIPDPRGAITMPGPAAQPFRFFGDSPYDFTYTFWSGIINYVTIDEKTLLDYYNFVISRGNESIGITTGGINSFFRPADRLASEVIRRANVNPININWAPDSPLLTYINAIQQLGFTRRWAKNGEAIWSDLFPGYFDQIRMDVARDPVFNMFEGGVFVVESDNTFRVMIMGLSVVMDSFGYYWDSIEMRFYSLQSFPDDPLTVPQALQNQIFLIDAVSLENVTQPDNFVPPNNPSWQPGR